MLALADATSPDHYSVANQAISIVKTSNPVTAEITKERSNQSSETYLPCSESQVSTTDPKDTLQDMWMRGPKLRSPRDVPLVYDIR